MLRGPKRGGKTAVLVALGVQMGQGIIVVEVITL